MSMIETSASGVVTARNIHRNGQVKTKEALPENHAATVEHGLTQYFAIVAERDQLKVQIDEMNRKLAAAEVECTALKQLTNMMENRVAMCQHDRDTAVAERAVYESLFISVQSMLRGFQIPSAPLIRDMVNQPESGQ